MFTTNHMKELINKPEPRKRVSIIRTVIVKERTILYGARQINTPELAAGLASVLFINAD